MSTAFVTAVPKKLIIVLANAFDAKYGTPLPIVLNILVSDIFSGRTKFAGKDWIAKASATDIRRTL